MDLNQLQQGGASEHTPIQPNQSLPEWNRPANAGSQGEGLKRQLLQKLMSNLLNKPGRSVHELMNGVKDAIGAYKNYAKEWDNLTIGGGGSASGATSGVKSSDNIQKILQGIQQKKGVTAGGLGGPSSMPQIPNMPTSQAMPALPPMKVPAIAGQPQQSDFNRPAPVSSLGIYGY
jgi:hypothetical protein